MPQLVRPHLSAPTRSTVEITTSNVGQFVFGPDQRLTVDMSDPVKGAWVLSSDTVDASGNTVETIPAHASLSPTSGPCAPPAPGAAQLALAPFDELEPCLAELKRLGYRQQVNYHAAGRFWAFQSYETAIYAAFAFALSGFCFWWVRRRVS